MTTSSGILSVALAYIPLVKKYVPETDGVLYYIVGSPQFADAMTAMLDEMGITIERLRGMWEDDIITNALVAKIVEIAMPWSREQIETGRAEVLVADAGDLHALDRDQVGRALADLVGDFSVRPVTDRSSCLLGLLASQGHNLAYLVRCNLGSLARTR